jgi:hypothetical protein
VIAEVTKCRTSKSRVTGGADVACRKGESGRQLAWTRRLGGVNTLLTYHTSEVRKGRATVYDPPTHEVASCERG